MERYLRLLGFDSPPSGLEGLREIVRRHVCRVPFENVSKLLLLRPPAFEEFLDGIEHRDLGGTCYTSNPFLADLLRRLGYDADLLGADMSTPNIHTSIRVRLADIEYHVDAGYGAPFRAPIRLDRLPHEIRQGGDRYVLERAARPDAYELSHFSGAERRHGYIVHGPARPFEFFGRTILDSYAPGRTFMSCLRIIRFFDRDAAEILNRTLIRHRGSTSIETRLSSAAELESAVANELAMPRCPVRDAAEVLERITGQPLFA